MDWRPFHRAAEVLEPVPSACTCLYFRKGDGYIPGESDFPRCAAPKSTTGRRGYDVQCPWCDNFVEVPENSSAQELTCNRCQRNLGSALDITHVYESANTTENVTELEIPEYEILEEIARGGMGVVYKAQHRQLNRLVALKVLKTGQFADELELLRFHSEAKSAGKLDHPGIVPVFDVGESNGHHYYSMALVNGNSLNEEIVARGPMSPRDAATHMSTVARAVHYAHTKGIVHRDIKPHNILKDFESGISRIADFGLAKQLDEDSALTATGQLIGTPSFMSPEQAAGRLDQIGPCSDVYSIGATFYFLLTARPPFQTSSIVDTVRQVIESEPLGPRMLNPNTPKDLETICLKCLRKSVEKRYRSADEVADDLDRWLSGRPILARPVPFIEKSWLWCKRRSSVVATIATASLMVAAISAFLINQRFDAEASRLVDGLLKAETQQVEKVIDELMGYQIWAEHQLQQAFNDPPNDLPNARLHSSLALLKYDGATVEYLREQLLDVEPVQLRFVRDLMAGHKSKLIGYYWSIATDQNSAPRRRFAALCALAAYDPHNEYWEDQSLRQFLASHLVNVLPHELLPLRTALRPVRSQFIDQIKLIMANERNREQTRFFAAVTLADYLGQDVTELYSLLAESDSISFEVFFDQIDGIRDRVIPLARAEMEKQPPAGSNSEVKELLAKRQANTAIMLLRLGYPEKVWVQFANRKDPRVRSNIIHWLVSHGASPDVLVEGLVAESELGIKQSLLLCLGEMSGVMTSEQHQIVVDCSVQFLRHEKNGIRSAAEWFLRKTDESERVLSVEDELTKNKQYGTIPSTEARDWFRSTLGHTFVVLDADEFQMGSPISEPGFSEREQKHRRTLNRRFAISNKEISRAQWRAFFQDVRHKDPLGSEELTNADTEAVAMFAPTGESTMIGMTWYEAAWYCNWLSDQEKIPEDQWCYLPNPEGKYGPGMIAKSSFLSLAGYRLPTEPEWEFTARAGTVTRRYYGGSDRLLANYAWYLANGEFHLWAGGLKKPNDFGVFDMLGNAVEWCHDRAMMYGDAIERSASSTDPETIADTIPRILRGGSIEDPPLFVRSAYRNSYRPDNRDSSYGFRPARTIHVQKASN